MTQKESQVPHLDAFIFRIAEQRRYSDYTVRNYKNSVEEWWEWLNQNDFFRGDISKIEKRIAKDYVAELARKYSRNTLHNKISALRSFYKFLIQTKDAETDPFSLIRLPKTKRSLPVFLNQAQIPELMEAPKDSAQKSHKSGPRSDFERACDTLILEMLYATGMRVSEICSIKWSDIDDERRIIRVLGKGNKVRFCPYGNKAAEALSEWRQAVSGRPSANGAVLSTYSGAKMYPRYIQRILKKYLSQSNLPMNITPHKLRHSFATHLVNENVNLRALQEMLGHANLSTTQIYTHLGTKQLQAEYNRHHPRA